MNKYMERGNGMKKIVLLLALLLTLAAVLTLVGCSRDDEADSGITISINRTYVNMTVGDTYTLAATVTPYEYADLAVSWRVSNPDVLRCTNGRLEALSVGKAVVTASLEGGEYFTCDIEVKEKLDNMYVVEGDVRVIGVERFENYFENAEYVSSSPDVVSVEVLDEGISFSALTPGKSTLSVTDGEGNLAIRTVVVLPEDTYGVNFTLPETPVEVRYVREDRFVTTLELVGFEVERSVDGNVLDTGEVTISLKVRFKKTSDTGVGNAIRFDVNIYSEETTGLLKSLRIFENDTGAAEYEYTFKFSALLGLGDGERNFYLEIPSVVG